MDSTVHKAFWVLEWLAAHPAPQRLTDIAAGVGMSKASVHRLLATLGELGYVAHDDVHGRYGVTLRLWEIGRGLIADTDLHTVAAQRCARSHRSPASPPPSACSIMA